MPTSRLSGNQIEDTTSAILTSLSFATQDSVLKLPTGNESQQPENPAPGMLRFNTTIDRAEQYQNVASNNQPGWKEIKGGGGGAGLGDYQLIRGNARSITEDLIIPDNVSSNYGFENAFTIGPEITVASPYTVTIPDGVIWTIIEDGDEPNTLDIAGVGSIIGPQWTNIGSGDGLGTYQLIRGNPRSISENITISFDAATSNYAYEESYSIGPEITINSGYTITIDQGSSWQILD